MSEVSPKGEHKIMSWEKTKVLKGFWLKMILSFLTIMAGHALDCKYSILKGGTESVAKMKTIDDKESENPKVSSTDMSKVSSLAEYRVFGSAPDSQYSVAKNTCATHPAQPYPVRERFFERDYCVAELGPSKLPRRLQKKLEAFEPDPLSKTNAPKTFHEKKS